MLSFLWTADAHKHSSLATDQWMKNMKTNTQQKCNSSLENVDKKQLEAALLQSHFALSCNHLLCYLAQTRKRGKWQFSSFMICSDDYCLQWHAGGLFSLLSCFLTLDVWSYCSWHQLEVSKKQQHVNHFISQLIHDCCKVLSSVQWYLKQRHGLTYLLFVYIIVKLQTYCIFSSFFCHMFFFYYY